MRESFCNRTTLVHLVVAVRRSPGHAAGRSGGLGGTSGSGARGAAAGGAARVGAAVGGQVLRAGVGEDVGLGLLDGDGGDEVVLVLGEGGQGRGGAERGPVAGAGQGVLQAGAAQGAGAGAGGVGIGDGVGGVDLGVLVEGLRDGLEGVSFNEGGGRAVGLECVTLHVGEDVVDGLDVAGLAVLAELGGTARAVVDVVAVEGDLVTVSVEHHGPVVVAVAGGGCGGLTVELGVGDGQAGWVVVGDDHHAADQRELAVVNPDTVVAIELESIATPDQTGVQVGDGDTLDDDVLGLGGKAETLALQNTLSVGGDDTLVAADLESVESSSVVLQVGHRGGIRLLTTAPVGGSIKSLLAGSLRTPWRAAGGGLGCASEVEGLGEVDHSGGVVRQQVGELRGRLGR